VAEKHKRDNRGRLQDGVRTRPVTAVERASYANAAAEVGRLEVPRMFDSSNPHSRLFIANFDGTGNDLWDDPEHATNVGKLHVQLLKKSAREPRIASGYVEGAGTQDGAIARVIDGATGHTYNERIEEMHRQLATQTAIWIASDPQAEIRVTTTGFSRGGDEAARFARELHERGIQNYAGRRVVHHPFRKDAFEWSLPPLRAPGKTLMSEILLDPVGTGTPNNYDRQPPGSVVSGVQFTAEDERRNPFPSSQIIPAGASADGRFIGFNLPGAHSDIGGSYHSNGLSTLTYNLVANYINGLSDVHLVGVLPEPRDEELYVVHFSEDHMPFYSTSEFRRDGHRDIMGAQASPPHCREPREVHVCAPPDPLDPGLELLIGPRHPVGVHDVRIPTHRDHTMYRSASVQLLELHARSGFTLDREQVDRLTAGLVVEAKQSGLTTIDDVQFDKNFDPLHPVIQAFEAFHGDLKGPRSKVVNVEALKALDTPIELTNQQLRGLNQEKGAKPRWQPELAPSRDISPALDSSSLAPARPSASMVEPSRAGTFDRDDDDAVRTLQQNLNTLGIGDMAGKPLATHGVYDIATQTAVARFQSEHALPVTGLADDSTRNTIQGQAFIAELLQPDPVRTSPSQAQETATAWSSKAGHVLPNHAGISRQHTASPSNLPSRSDPRSPDSPHHDLYNELQRCLPEAAEDRLVQFTAVCHRHRITAGNLSELHLDEDRNTLSIDSDDLMSTPAVVDLSVAAPEPGQSIRQIQQFDQQMDQIAQESQERSAQMAQQGPVM
jgi:peptidoglycan hydrolase-like protein with peptidoglycan-binding domain